MIDFERIGRRILEERKYLRGISQEKMAEDLGLYQADISNLEKAKSGSGITDLTRLDMIAAYFDMPLETLLFGRRQDHMEKYCGSRMQLRENAHGPTKRHATILRGLMGLGEAENAAEILRRVKTFECGACRVYAAVEHQIEITGAGRPEEERGGVTKVHLYAVYQDEVIGCCVAFVTTMMQHIFEPALERLQTFIMPDLFDLSETLEVLNPYLLLSGLPVSAEEREENLRRMYGRMDELRRAGEDRVIYYVENAYVREDCRRHGILRMMLDVLKRLAPSALIWLSLEPTSGEELRYDYAYHAAYKASELGQINLNASIAERLGFTIDESTAMLPAERAAEDGSVSIETVPVRRTAYLLPREIRAILRRDGSLTAQARARARVADGAQEEEDGPDAVDIYQGAWKKYGFVISIRLTGSDGTVYAFARGKDWASRRLGVSRQNPAPTGESVETLEDYGSLAEAEGSEYYAGLRAAEQLLGAVYFQTVAPEDVDLDALR